MMKNGQRETERYERDVVLLEKVSGQQPRRCLPFSLCFLAMRVNIRVQKQTEK